MVLMYTGGTTGLAKGVLLEQRAEMLNLYHIGLAVEFAESRVYLHQTPMFHAASMGGVLGIPATAASSVFVPLFEPEPVHRRHRALSRRLDGDGADDDRHAARPSRSSVPNGWRRYATSSTARRRCRPRLLERCRQTFPDLNLWQGYGMTECSSVLTS